LFFNEGMQERIIPAGDRGKDLEGNIFFRGSCFNDLPEALFGPGSGNRVDDVKNTLHGLW